ncbi:unnamed protein product [Rotaria sp. Silwood1]|nr:unnamed protein product [Rotaria sp. Silwood1]CAF1652266.1 unnamed protein product [Rotaria sp. Silwood1]CAF3867965.1 unnamed protein product [Rotaria sp. Silwood1]CAF3875873.1 unnamed protein product [Rotaria sp. Silwood1]CAF3937339.1 unnamed protein product [Rotaria sp. Silwood1]
MTSMPDITVDYLLDERDELEKERLQEVVIKSFPKIKLEDELFKEFVSFNEQIKSKLEKSLPMTDSSDINSVESSDSD